VSEIVLPYKWKPRAYQMPLWKYFQGADEGKRATAVWHRRAGKDLFGINLVQSKIPERVGTYWHLLPTYKQGRAIVWNGFTRDGRAFLDYFHPDLVKGKNATEMRVTFYNGANYQVVGTDDINSLVGTNPIGCIFSEYSLHDPGAWEYIRPILAENGGWALFIYTARGRNHGYTLLEMAKGNKKWFSQVLIAGNNGTKRDDGKPVISDEIIAEERASNMPEPMIQQEFYCSFDAPFVGAYYGPQMMSAERDGRMLEILPYEPRLPVHTAWDLGMDDTTAIWFYQILAFEIRIIDYYENSGEGLAHYAKVLKGQVADNERMGEYVYGMHNAPHDIKVRELGTGKSREDTAKEMGMKFRVCRKHNVEDGIEQVRLLLPRCYFNKKYCMRGIEALRQYRKEWDDKNKCFKSHPLHDWTSNGSDAFRILAMSQKDRSKNGSGGKQQENAVDEHDYLR
jgi:phage terminase large subunit